MAKQTVKKVNFRVDRGIRINGESIYPGKDKKKPTIISIRETLAKELVNASKGEIVNDKVTTQVKEPSSEDADLDAAFGPDGEE